MDSGAHLILYAVDFMPEKANFRVFPSTTVVEIKLYDSAGKWSKGELIKFIALNNNLSEGELAARKRVEIEL